MNRIRYSVLVVRAFWELVRYDLLHAGSGFQRIFKQVSGLPVKSRRQQAHSEASICDAVLLATCLYWKPVLCLQRSVAATRLLRKQGIHGRLVIGYRPVPFMSHAWVEVNSRVVNDSPGYKTRLQVLCTA